MYVHISLCVCAHGCRCPQRLEACVASSVARVTGSGEAPSVGAGSQTRVSWMNAASTPNLTTEPSLRRLHYKMLIHVYSAIRSYSPPHYSLLASSPHSVSLRHPRCYVKGVGGIRNQVIAVAQEVVAWWNVMFLIEHSCFYVCVDVYDFIWLLEQETNMQ